METNLNSLIFAAMVLFSSHAVMAESDAGHKPAVGDIKDSEIDRIDRRVKSHQFTSVGFGPFGSSKSNDGGVMYGLSYGKTWEANETGEIRVDSQLAANGKNQYVNFGLGYGYLASTGDFSPVLGAQLGGGYAHYKSGDETKNAGGFSGGVYAGMRFLRTADTQLELLGSYNAIFAQDTPGFYGLQLRILY